MRQQIVYLSLLLIVSLTGFIGYCYALVDWLQDLKHDAWLLLSSN